MTRLGHIIEGLHSRDSWDGVTADAALVSATDSENSILNLLLGKK